MKTTKWTDLKRAKGVPDARAAANEAWVQTELDAMELRELRELAGKTQAETAAAAAMAQSELSRFETRDDRRVSTLRRYVEALGGELEIVAVLGDRRVTLRGV